MSIEVQKTEDQFSIADNSYPWGLVTVKGRKIKKKGQKEATTTPDTNYFVPALASAEEVIQFTTDLLTLAEQKKAGGANALFLHLTSKSFKDAFEAATDEDGNADNDKLLAEVVNTERAGAIDLEAYMKALLEEYSLIQNWVPLSPDVSAEELATLAENRERDGVSEDEATRRYAAWRRKTGELRKLEVEAEAIKTARAEKREANKAAKAAKEAAEKAAAAAAAAKQQQAVA